MTNILQAAEIVLKWRKARDTVYRLFTVGDTEGEAKFRERMKTLQLLIRACMRKHGLELIPAIIQLGNESEGMLAVQVLAAGYDLTEGIDYTIEENAQDKSSVE